MAASGTTLYMFFGSSRSFYGGPQNVRVRALALVLVREHPRARARTGALAFARALTRSVARARACLLSGPILQVFLRRIIPMVSDEAISHYIFRYYSRRNDICYLFSLI